MQITIDSLPRVLREGPVLPLWMSNSVSELKTFFQEWLQMISNDYVKVAVNSKQLAILDEISQ